MGKVILSIVASVMGCIAMNAQTAKSLADYSGVKFYGIDFAPVKVVGASESQDEFIDAFGKINRLFLTEPDKYIDPLSERLKKKITAVDIDCVLNHNKGLDTEELKINHTAPALTRQDLEFELQDLEIAPEDGLGLLVVAGELNKGTDYGTFYYVFFDNRTMTVIDTWAFKGKSGGLGLCNYWARSFYRTIAEINPTKFYQSKKKIKEGVTDGVEAVKEKVTGQKN